MTMVISSRFDNYVHEYDLFTNHTVKLSGVEKIQLNNGSQDLMDERIEFIQFGEGVTQIEDYCCANMEDLTSVVLPSTIKTIGSQAFYNSSICESVALDNVESIGFAAFTGTSLTAANLPNTLTYLGPQAFAWSCLTKVVIPSSLAKIHYLTFIANHLESVDIPEGITYIAEDAFANNELTSISLPNSLSVVEPGAFSGNDLHEVSLPPSVAIFDQSFSWNENLSSVTIPDNVKICRGNPFYRCPKLSSTKEVNININNTQYLKNGGIGLIDTDNSLIMPLDDLPFEDVQPVKSIGMYCYAYNESINSVGLNEPNLSSIADYAFFWAQNLTAVSFGQNNIKSIGQNAFNHCDLRKLNLPSSLTNIKPRSFAFNEKLSSVNIPASISSIESDAFYDCTDLRDVYMTGDYTIAPSIAENAFENTGVEGTGCLIHVKNKAMYDLFNNAGLSSLSSIGGIVYSTT